MAWVRVAFPDFSPEFLDELLFSRFVDVAVKHPAIWIVVCFMEQNRIVAQYHMLSAVCDFFVVLDILEELFYLFAELLWVMISPYQHLLSGQRSEIVRPVRFFCPAEISEDIHCVIRLNSGVPVVDYLPVHLLQSVKMPVVESDDIGVAKVQVSNIIVHSIPFSIWPNLTDGAAAHVPSYCIFEWHARHYLSILEYNIPHSGQKCNS